MTGKLTTHVLDIAHRCPATDVEVELWAVEPNSGQKSLLKTTKTNEDGCTDIPLLAEEELKGGVYAIVFAVGQYFGDFNNLPTPHS